MDKTQQQIKIAEACGWTGVEEIYIYYGFTREIPDRRTRWTPPNGGRPTLNLPDYLNDLNAMHEAEKVMLSKTTHDFDDNLWSNYLGWLCMAAPAGGMHHATAAQRAEAFLRTLGLWEAPPPHVEDAINHEREHADYMEKLQRERDGCREVPGLGYMEEDYNG